MLAILHFASEYLNITVVEVQSVSRQNTEKGITAAVKLLFLHQHRRKDCHFQKEG